MGCLNILGQTIIMFVKQSSINAWFIGLQVEKYSIGNTKVKKTKTKNRNSIEFS